MPHSVNITPESIPHMEVLSKCLPKEYDYIMSNCYVRICAIEQESPNSINFRVYIVETPHYTAREFLSKEGWRFVVDGHGAGYLTKSS